MNGSARTGLAEVLKRPVCNFASRRVCIAILSLNDVFARNGLAEACQRPAANLPRRRAAIARPSSASQTTRLRATAYLVLGRADSHL